MSGRFALVGTGVILLTVGCVATVGTEGTWLEGYGMIAYFLVPLALVPVTAAFLASPRANQINVCRKSEVLALIHPEALSYCSGKVQIPFPNPH